MKRLYISGQMAQGDSSYYEGLGYLVKVTLRIKGSGVICYCVEVLR